MGNLLDSADKVGPCEIVAVSDVYAPHRDAVKERSNWRRDDSCRLSRGAGEGHRRRVHRVAGSLACSDGVRCPVSRQGRLSGKAGHPHARGRGHAHSCGSLRQADSAVRHAAAQLDSLSRCSRSDPGRQPRAQSPRCGRTGGRTISESWKPKPIDAQALDWKLWLGSAPDQPFSEEKFYRWRWFWNFGGGAMTDLFTHWIDVVHWAMKSDQPREGTDAGRQIYLRAVGLP